MMVVRDSTVGSLLLDAWRRGRVALASARTTHLIRAVIGGAVAATERSLLVHSLATAKATDWSSVVRQSRLFGTTRWLWAHTRTSWVYRWIMAESATELVVIDLRDTVVSGPAVRLFDRLSSPVLRHWDDALTRTMCRDLYEAFLASPVRVLSVVTLVVTTVSLLAVLASDPSPVETVGVRLLVACLALAGTQVRASVDDLVEMRIPETLFGSVSSSQSDRDDRRS